MYKKIKQFYQSLTKQEKVFIWAWIVFLAGLTSLPWLYANLVAGSDIYTGKTIIAGADKSIYYSLINQAAEGQILLKNLYTPGPQIGLFSPLWLVLGWLKALTGLSAITIFHLSRLLLLMCFVWSLYFLLAKAQARPTWRWVGLGLTIFGGLGFLTIFRDWTPDNQFNYFASDIWFSEGHIFTTLYHSPLFILSQILLVTLIYWLAERAEHCSTKESILMFVLTIFLGLIHPYDLVTLAVIFIAWFVYQVIKTKKFPRILFIKQLVIGSAAALAVGYFLIMTRVDPGFTDWAKQNVTLSPAIKSYLLGFAPLLVLFILGFKPAWQSQKKFLQLFCLWGIIGWFLLYFPLNFQRRLGSGLAVPLVVIGVWGAKVCWQKIKGWSITLKSALVVVVVAIFLITPGLHLGLEIAFLSDKESGLFISQDYRASLEFLKKLPANSLILADRIIGNLIPAWSGQTVLLGHGHQSANWGEKLAKVEMWFYASNQSDKQKELWLQENNINYIFFGPQEKSLGDFQPSQKDYLELVFKQGEVEIYRVK